MKFKTVWIIIMFFQIVASKISAADDNVKVYYEESKNGGFNIFADNLSIIPCFIKIEFTELKNLNTSEKMPYSTVLKPQSKKNPIVSLRVISKTEAYSFKYSVKYAEGDPYAKPDESFAYFFPYEHGKKFRLSQGNNGKFTHFDENKYSFDFDMEIGTPIAAARDGLVIGIKDDSNIGGPDVSYSEYGNFILIYHSDGTFGNYVHLKQYGVLVKKGDKVSAGSVIGYSGNTGRSSGPHLHFDVRLPTEEGVTQSIPVKFLNYDSAVISLDEGEYYYSFHTGKPAFDIVLGKNIANKDYEGYSKDINAIDNLEIRDEKMDNTILFFVRNGFSEKKEVTIEFVLTNLSASKPVPYTFTAPPKKEIFILFLRTIDSTERREYSCSYSYKVPLK